MSHLHGVSYLLPCVLSVISNSIQLLVQDLDAACDPALTAMSKVRHTCTHPAHDICLRVLSIC